MSDALQRLLGRALGESAGGLRPRRPSRFESPVRQSGFEEVHTEMTTSPVPKDRRVADAPPVGAARPIADRARPQPEVPSAGKVQASAERTLSHEPKPAPLAGRVDAATPATRTPPLNDRLTPASRAEASRAPAPRQDVLATAPQAPPPAPLLPEATPEAAEPGAMLGPGRLPPSDPILAIDSATEAAEPEITIHIGHLDVRAEPARPPRPTARESRRRPLPGLSDYLRGGDA